MTLEPVRRNVSFAETAAGGYGVQQELTGHNSHINCLAFDMEGQFLFSGDKSGNIRMWETPEMFDPESSTGSSGPPAVSLRRGRSNLYELGPNKKWHG